MRSIKQFAIALIITTILILGWSAESYSDERFEEVCEAWLEHAAGDMALVKYHQAGCPLPEKETGVVYIDYLDLDNIPVYEDVDPCDIWYEWLEGEAEEQSFKEVCDG